VQGRKKNGVANRLKAAAKANGEQRRPGSSRRSSTTLQLKPLLLAILAPWCSK